MTHSSSTIPSIRSHVIIADLAALILIFIGFAFLSPDLVLLTVWILFYPYLRLTRRAGLLKYFLLSNAFGLIWFYLSKGLIRYSQEMLSLDGHQLFVLFGWSLGLILLRILYNDGVAKLKIKKRWVAFLLFCGAYGLFLTTAEAVGYHLCGINNELARDYSGLPGVDALHGPVWQQAGYMLTGPLYLLASFVLERSKPNHLEPH